MKNKVLRIAVVGLMLSNVSLVSAMTTTELYEKYKKQPNNRAFAIGLNGAAGASWRAASTADAISQALEACENSGGQNCNVTELNGSPLSASNANAQVKNFKTVNNYNVKLNGINYSPDLTFSASGFFVNREYLVTTSDLVENCSKINYERNGRLVGTTVVRADKVNGIAVLKTSVPNDSTAVIASKKKTNQGERTYTYGYDLSDMVNSQIPSYQGKITDGIISLASGRYNDIRYMTITNDISEGNIGGPVITENGDVSGMLTNTKKQTVKSSVLSIFLYEQGISFTERSSKANKGPAKIAQDAQNFVVPMVCLQEI